MRSSGKPFAVVFHADCGKEAAQSTGDTQYDSLSEILRRAIPSSARYSPRRHRV